MGLVNIFGIGVLLIATAAPIPKGAEPDYIRVEAKGELRIKEVFLEPDSAVVRPNRSHDLRT